MTRAEAIQAMKDGKKITHLYFSSNEYLYMDKDGGVSSEDGVYWGYIERDLMRGTCLDVTNKIFDIGWEIYKK